MVHPSAGATPRREHLTKRGLIRERRNPNALRAVLGRGRTSDLTWSASPTASTSSAREPTCSSVPLSGCSGERWETSSRTLPLIRPDQRGARFS